MSRLAQCCILHIISYRLVRHSEFRIPYIRRGVEITRHGPPRRTAPPADPAKPQLSFVSANWSPYVLSPFIRVVGMLASVLPTTAMSTRIFSHRHHHQCAGAPSSLETDSRYCCASLYWQQWPPPTLSECCHRFLSVLQHLERAPRLL